ncbi:MAG: response regulator [Desulfobulbaceae bacterium]|nr:response regulator [Desulfobulbaceae bacterium]
MKPLVLIVDDMPANLNLLANLLKNAYEIRVANNGAKALELAQVEPLPDAILLDVMMPNLDGWTVCEQLKSIPATARIPILFLTAKNSIQDEEHGLNLGAVDFISKPISPPIVLARLRTHLQNREYQKFLEDKTGWLEMEVQKKLSRITQLHEASILVMVSLAEFRDECTGWHIKRTQEFVKTLALELAKLPRFINVLTADYIEKLYKSAPLHDIGKIAIPDHILLKPGKLTEEEIEIMKSHAPRGAQMLRQAQQYTSESDGFFEVAIEIAQSHHERWDGKGYPDNLSGEAIPFAARIMAVADVYDALTTVRPYKSAFSHEKACEMIRQGGPGGHFDPVIITALEHCQSSFVEIAARWSDTHP